MVLFAAGKLQHRQFINIRALRELRGIQVGPESITLGALTTYTDVLHHQVVRSELPLLAAAADATGSIATQNRGTLGGNIVNASPAADTPPVLLVYNAEVELTSTHGSRWMPYRDFHSGYKQMQLQSDELVTRIRIPRMATRCRYCFRKVGARKTQTIAKICFAGLHDLETNDIRIALGSVSPLPLRCFQTESAIRNQSDDPIAVVAREIAPISDFRSTSEYRRLVAQNLLREFLNGK